MFSKNKINKCKKINRSLIATTFLLTISGCVSTGKIIPKQDFNDVIETHSEGKLLSKTDNEKRILFNVNSGDTLSSIFEKADAKQAFFSQINKTELNMLAKIMPGDIVEITTDNDGNLITMAKTVKGEKDYWITVNKKRNGSFNVAKEKLKATYRDRYVKGTIDNNFLVAARGLSIEQPVAREFIELMRNQFDIENNKVKGDTFKISYRQMYLNKRPVGEPIITGAHYEEATTLKLHTAFLYRNSSGYSSYYNANGQPIAGSGFDYHPLKSYSRISSRFNLKRRHPITREIRPHRGTDYAAPTGTPIYSPSDGKVVYKGYQNGYGNVVKISHQGNIQTLYAHMHKFHPNAKVGNYVKRGEQIGYVGSTGMSTGPHLHYEFHVNGKAVDSLVEKKKLAGGTPLKSEELIAFRRHISKINRRMASIDKEEGTFITYNWNVEDKTMFM